MAKEVMLASEFCKYVKEFLTPPDGGHVYYGKSGHLEKITVSRLNAVSGPGYPPANSAWYNSPAVIRYKTLDVTNYDYLLQKANGKNRMADCHGLIKGIMWGFRADGTIKTDDRVDYPDKSEDVMCAPPYADVVDITGVKSLSNVKINGMSVPPGALVWQSGHVGVVVDPTNDNRCIIQVGQSRDGLSFDEFSWSGAGGWKRVCLSKYIDYSEYGLYDKNKNSVVVNDNNIPVIEVLRGGQIVLPRVIQIGNSTAGYLPYNAFRKVTKLDHDSESLKYTYKSLWQKQVISSTVTIRKTIDCLNASGFMMDIFLNRMPEADKVSNAIDAQNTFYAKWDFGIGYMALMYKIQAVAHDKSKYWVSIWAKTNIKSNKGEPNEKYANWANVTGYYTEIGSEGRQSLYVIGKILSSEETVLESPYANDAFKPTFFHNLTNNEAQFSFPYSPKLDRPTHYASSYPRLTIGTVFDGETEHPMMTSVDNMAVTAYYDSIGNLI